jgi:ABC-type branched-subunit amino acid transport system substrate-binding protein
MIICMFVLTACVAPAEEGEIKQVNGDVFTIGLLATLTGPAAVHGTHVVLGAEKAVEELNANGINVKLVVEDNQNDPKVALNAYQKLLLSDPDVIFTTMSGASAAIIPLAQEAGIPVVTSLTYADFREYNHVYQYFQTTEDLTEIASAFFVEENIERVGLLARNIEAGHALMDVAQKKFVEEGIEIVGLEYYESGDVRTPIMKLVEKGVDAFYVFDLRPDKVVDQIKEQYDGVVVFTDTPVATNLHKTYPGFEGVYAAAQQYMISGTDEHDQFESLFVDANAEAGMGYDVVHLIFEAHALGEFPESIISLETFSGLNGAVDLSSSRKPSIPIQMVLIEGGELV